MMRAFARRQATLSIGWLRVGYVQGNMNSDNCFVSGRTMDYGPFGFIEKYEQLWSPFTSDMERKFGFERQPLASQVNLMTLARALLPLFERESEYERSMETLQSIVQDDYPALLKPMMGEMYRAKLGLSSWDTEAGEKLLPQLQALLAKSSCDYTIFWRELAGISLAEAQMVVEVGVAGAAAMETDDGALNATDPMLARLAPCFFDGVPSGNPQLLSDWRRWMVRYAQRLASEGRPDSERQTEMRLTSPKFIPREWVLAEAYTAAERGDYSILHELLEVFSSPYDEHPEAEAKYYRTPPAAMVNKAGISYFS